MATDPARRLRGNQETRGKQPFRELAKVGPLPLGHAVLTNAGTLPFQGIIHVAGINLLWRSSEYSVRESVRNAMRIATDQGFRSIAFPLIGAGSGGGKATRILNWMQDELTQTEYQGDVRIVRYHSR